MVAAAAEQIAAADRGRITILQSVLSLQRPRRLSWAFGEGMLDGRMVGVGADMTYSVSFRLQRTTTEFAFVSVPVTADLIVQQPDGSGRIDSAKMVQLAIEMGLAPDVAWHLEDRQVQPHPIQMPPPGLEQE